MTWDEYFLEMALVVAKKSKDRSTKVGAVIVGPANEVRGTGFNGIPRGMDDDVPVRHERPHKYMYFVHAEENAICTAARNGVSLLGCTIYCTAPPCSSCARGIIQSGITKVCFPIDHPFAEHEGWTLNFEAAREMLEEAGVEIVWLR
jgi:dCMP deaminase